MATISICIPAFKRTDFLKRLLDSVAIQTYQDYDVIVSDDSASEEVEALCNSYLGRMNLKYYKNSPALGTPENWNEAIRKATGNWIKLMHDDDWFADCTSLQKFANAIDKSADFVFAAYNNVFEDTGAKKVILSNSFRQRAMLKNPVTLIADNIIGPPSVVMHRNDQKHWYDKNVKWVVDMEFYIRFLQTANCYYIDEPLINVGLNKEQVTQYTFGIPEVHLKENFYLLNKVGEKSLANIIVFDAWWRLLRNFKVKNLSYIREIGYDGPIPKKIVQIISFQNKIPSFIVKSGVLSKILMTVCFAISR